MAKAWRQPVISTNGRLYTIGDPIIMKLKDGKILTGVIKNIRFSIGRESYVDLRVAGGEITIETNLIND